MPIDDTEEEALQHTAWEELLEPNVACVQKLTAKYDSRTYEALVSGRGSHSQEKKDYKRWLNWVFRPAGKVDTRRKNKALIRSGTRALFRRVIVTRNGSSWDGSADDDESAWKVISFCFSSVLDGYGNWPCV